MISLSTKFELVSTSLWKGLSSTPSKVTYKIFTLFLVLFALVAAPGFAQEIKSIDSMFSTASAEDKEVLSDLLYGKNNVMDFESGVAQSSNDQEGSIKTVRLGDASNFSLLNNLGDDLASVQALTLKASGNNSIQFDQSVLAKMPDLKYVYVIFDQYMSETEVLSKFALVDTYSWVILYSLSE